MKKLLELLFLIVLGMLKPEYSIAGFKWIFINLLKKCSITPDIRKQPQASLESI